MTTWDMDRRTGTWVRDGAGIQQSINDILTTKLGSRLLARDYGSNVPSRVDAPMNDRNILALYADIYAALVPRKGLYGTLGEPRFSLQRIAMTAASLGGQISFSLIGVVYPNGHKGDFTPASNGQLVSYVFNLAQGVA